MCQPDGARKPHAGCIYQDVTACHIYPDVTLQARRRSGKARQEDGLIGPSMLKGVEAQESPPECQEFVHPLTQDYKRHATNSATHVAGKVKEDPWELPSRPGQNRTSTTGMAMTIRMEMLVPENAKPAQQSTNFS